jgi:hypothetical protein
MPSVGRQQLNGGACLQADEHDDIGLALLQLLRLGVDAAAAQSHSGVSMSLELSC